MQTQHLWEIGSEFDWSDRLTPLSPTKSLLPESYQLFATGRCILLSLQHLFANDQTRLRLHLPSFFCMDVAADLAKVYELRWYRDLPTEPAPDFNTLHPSPGDLVLAANLFGIRQEQPWQNWSRQYPDVILIEDHTHDPFSPWARQSTAHYAMASLRKTLPIPDGAIVWSPCNMHLPRPTGLESLGAHRKLMAMVLKRAYLDGANLSKEAYRSLQIQGEKSLNSEINAAASSFTATILNCLNISMLRRQREANIRKFLELGLAKPDSGWKFLFEEWQPGCVPFNSVLVCKNHAVREALRKFLITQNIFSAIHWQQPLDGFVSDDPDAVDLSNRILTIPTDHRYSNDDIARVAEKIIEFFQVQHTLV